MLKYLHYWFVQQRDIIPSLPCAWVKVAGVRSDRSVSGSEAGFKNNSRACQRVFERTTNTRLHTTLGRRDFQTVNSRPSNSADANANRLMLIYSIFTLLLDTVAVQHISIVLLRCVNIEQRAAIDYRDIYYGVAYA